MELFDKNFLQSQSLYSNIQRALTELLKGDDGEQELPPSLLNPLLGKRLSKKAGMKGANAKVAVVKDDVAVQADTESKAVDEEEESKPGKILAKR